MRIRRSWPELTPVDDVNELMARLVHIFDCAAQRALEAQNRFCVGLQQSTPQPFFNRLRSHSRLELSAWRRTHLFSVDQYCDASNSHNGRHNPVTCECAARIPVPAENVHRICAECRSCEFTASAYECRIRNLVRGGRNGVSQFDLLLLQMDAEGRIASLVPDSYAFYESQRLVWVTRFTGAGITQITITHPVLHAASHIAVVVSGHEKAVTLREVFLAEPDAVRYPVHALWPVLDKVTWLVDRAAAKFLPPSAVSQTAGQTPWPTGGSIPLGKGKDGR